MSDHPFVSILMPIRNELSTIGISLGHVLEQSYPGDCMEIILAIGHSSDGTTEYISSFRMDHPHLPISSIHNDRCIVSAGLNAALRVARGDIIIRVDGHTEIAPDYVRQCVDTILRSRADTVGGKMNAIGKTSFGEGVAIATSSPFGVGGARFHYSDQQEWVDTVYMGAWRREIFEKIGLFDEELVRNQDDEFSYRLRAHGGKILLSPMIKSKYIVRGNPWALWKQYFQYGVWKVRVLQKHPRQMRPRQFVPPAFVASILGSAILSLFHPAGKYLLALILAAYLSANLVASVWAANKRGWKHLPLLPVVYAILHLSYGLGFLVGLVRFIHRWGDKKGKVPEWKPVEPGSQGAWRLGSAGAGEHGDAD